VVNVVSIEELGLATLRKISSLYIKDPITHVYLMYDLMYEFDRTSVYMVIDNNDIKGYMLIWRGGVKLGIHIWGYESSIATHLIKHIPLSEESIIQVYNEGMLPIIIEFLKGKGNIEIKYFLDMIVREDKFNPYRPNDAVRLSPDNDQHLSAFIELKRISGIHLDHDKAHEYLKKQRYYGVFKNDTLVSMACAYLRLPEVWMIGSVFTHPEYRGQGFAKVVTSAITRDALLSGAIASLHVMDGNEPAIKVYRRLGYEVIRRRPWVFFTPKL